MKRKRRSNPYPNERPADLIFWFRNGSCGGYCARVKACREVSIGRTDSKRGLGFIVSWGPKNENWIDFVLDKDQVAELAAYLKHCPPLLKPLGRKRNQMSLAAMYAPKHQAARIRRRARRHPT
jgi:hypothetical protein